VFRSPYNVKVTKRGLRASRNFAASQIQAFVRSFLTRRRLVKTLSKRPSVKALRSEYESVVLRNWSKEAICSTSTMIVNTDKLLEASEDALAASRRIFSQIKLAPEKESDEFQPAVERCIQDQSCSVCLCPFKGNTVALRGDEKVHSAVTHSFLLMLLIKAVNPFQILDPPRLTETLIGN